MPTQTPAQKKAAAKRRANAAAAAADKAAAELRELEDDQVPDAELRELEDDQVPDAELEDQAKPRTFTMHGVTLDLPEKVPFKVLRVMHKASQDDGAAFALEMLELILGAEQLERLDELGVEEGFAVVEGALGELGLTPGKSSASADS